MRIDIDQHARMLLDFLHETANANVAEYLTSHELTVRDGIMLVDYLANRGLVRDCSTMGGPDADITAEGVALAQRLRAERMSPAQRLGCLRTRMLAWLDQHGQRQRGPIDWSGFLSGPNVEYYGTTFTKEELTREAEYLHDHGLINSISSWQATSGMIRPTITAEGRDCLIDFEGNVSNYLNRGQRPNTTTNMTNNITMTDSSGNITVASDNVVQNINAGLDTTKLLEFAGFVRQTLPILNLDQDTQDILGAQTEELHQEAEAANPDRSKVRRLVDAILNVLRQAAPTVVQTAAIGMGEEAIKVITGT